MLRAALATIHRDPYWWQTILIGGLLLLTVIGAPLAAGLVLESLENSRRGFPTPLPPWRGADWSTRYLMGLFALLLDFFFFGMPLILALLLSFCLGSALVVSGAGDHLPALAAGLAGALLLFWGLLFLSSVAPVARLIYAQQGQAEEALSSKPLRWALATRARGPFWRARLTSLPAYLPVLLLLLLLAMLLRQTFAGCAPLSVLLAWLAASALLYAHLIVVQLYVAAERMVE